MSNMIKMALILEQVLAQLDEQEALWLQQQVALVSTSTERENDLLNASVVVKRTIHSEVCLTDYPFQYCRYDEIIRIILISSALLGLENTPQQTLLKQYYRAGDSAEKCALLKGLSLLDIDGDSVNLAINAVRGNDVVEFSALALNNTYASQFFPELNFNQLILKCLFMNVELHSVLNLAQRLNTNLTNMSFSYAIEQALSARVPPASLWLTVVQQDLNLENQQLVPQYLSHFSQLDESHQGIIKQLISRGQLLAY